MTDEMFARGVMTGAEMRRRATHHSAVEYGRILAHRERKALRAKLSTLNEQSASEEDVTACAAELARIEGCLYGLGVHVQRTPPLYRADDTREEGEYMAPHDSSGEADSFAAYLRSEIETIRRRAVQIGQSAGDLEHALQSGNRLGIDLAISLFSSYVDDLAAMGREIRGRVEGREVRQGGEGLR